MCGTSRLRISAPWINLHLAPSPCALDPVFVERAGWVTPRREEGRMIHFGGGVDRPVRTFSREERTCPPLVGGVGGWGSPHGSLSPPFLVSHISTKEPELLLYHGFQECVCSGAENSIIGRGAILDLRVKYSSQTETKSFGG